MGQIKSSIVLEKGLRAEFMSAFDNGENPADVMPMIMETTSTSDKEKYGWLGESPSLSEWIDSRQLKGVLDFDYEIKNKHYEGTLQVDRDDIEDDNYGMINTRIQDLAGKARIHPRKLFFETLVAGTTDLCFDGVAFFSASHKYTAAHAAQSNIHTGTKAGTYPTAAEFALDFELMTPKMESFVDSEGEPFNEGELKYIIVASPNLKPILQKVFNADLLSSSTNTLKGAASFVTSARLSGADWYLMETSGNLKPIVKQNRQAPEFAALEKTSEAGFMLKKFKYGIDYRVGFGYGLWQKAMKCAY